MTLTPLGPQLHQLLQTISLYGRWSTSGSDRGIAHFFTATRNTIDGAGETKKEEQTNKTNKMLGLTQVQKRSYVTLCMCGLTLAWATSENSTTLLECRLIFPHCGWTQLMPTGLSAPVPTGHSRHPSPTANFSVALSHSLTGVPFLLTVTPRSQVQNLCLVSRQNRQRNRLLGGPPTQCYNGFFVDFQFISVPYKWHCGVLLKHRSESS